MGSTENWEWPWQYSFPPFFTLQPHAETKSRQLAAWRNLVLDYHSNRKESTLDIQEAIRCPLFFNASINRKLNTEFILLILHDLARTKNAAPCDKTKNRWEIYWHTLDEWASIIHNYAISNGLTNTVCTLYELSQSDSVANEEFFGLDKEVFIKVLRVLESQGKCELINTDEDYGVKFY